MPLAGYSKETITRVDGFVRLDSTAAKFPIVFVVKAQEGSSYRRPDETWGIPAGSDFHIQAHFTDETKDRPGIDVERFVALYPGLTFVFNVMATSLHVSFRHKSWKIKSAKCGELYERIWGIMVALQVIGDDAYGGRLPCCLLQARPSG